LALSNNESDTRLLVDNGDIPQDQLNDNKTPPVITRSGHQEQPPRQLFKTCTASATEQGGGFKLEAKYNYGRQPKDKVLSLTFNQQFLKAMKWNQVINLLWLPDLSAMNAWMEGHSTNPEHGTIEEWHPFAFSSQINPTWEEAISRLDKSGNWKVCEREIHMLEGKECWDIIQKENWMNLLLGTWAF
jgi:hypothetical protein